MIHEDNGNSGPQLVLDHIDSNNFQDQDEKDDLIWEQLNPQE